MDFYNYLMGNLSDDELESCRNKSLSFYEKKYNRKIKHAHLNKYRKRYEEECVARLKDGKNLQQQTSLFFQNLNLALALQKQFVMGKLLFLPQWVKSYFTLETLLNFMKTVPKQFEMPELATSEMVLNFIFYCISFGVSWSQYFLFFKEGRDILKKALFENELVSILAFAEAAYMVGVTKSYDEGLFRKELYESFPDIEKYLDFDPSKTGIYRTIALFLVGKISFAVFRATVLKIASLVTAKK
jgi:hypothetical protein